MSDQKEISVKPTFEEELIHLINRHSKENESNTPDFILAGYIEYCLLSFTTATKLRDKWWSENGRKWKVTKSFILKTSEKINKEANNAPYSTSNHGNWKTNRGHLGY